VVVSGVQDYVGNTQSGSYSFSFSTGTLLTERFPEDEARNVPVNTPVYLLFASEINSSAATLSLSGGGQNVSGTTGHDQSLLRFTPDANLSYNTTYTVTASGITDLYGIALDTVSWTFATVTDTIAPVILSTIPASGGQGVSPSAAITVTFNETVDISDATLLLQSTGGKQITGTLNATGAVLTFTPASSLASGTDYFAVLDGVTDSAGNRAQSHLWTFTTQ